MTLNTKGDTYQNCLAFLSILDKNYKDQVSVTAFVEEVIISDKRSKGRILLKYVCINKQPFRDHIWIDQNGITKKMCKEDTIMAFAKARIYRSQNTFKIKLYSWRTINRNTSRFVNYYK